MEGPTTTRRVASCAHSSTFSSERMLEAQRMFQSVVKQELQLLLVSGTKREEAVKLLLRRIVASTEAPDAVAVRSVMRQFLMNHDDAVRALIVKQELGRLKRQGLDSFAAIEELTRKMKSREVNEEAKEVTNAKERTSLLTVREAMPAAEMASPIAEKDGNETSLSLIQRIGQVSISSSSHTPERKHEECSPVLDNYEGTGEDEHEGEKESSKTLVTSLPRVQSPTTTYGVDLTPPSRKRRAALGSQLDPALNHTTRSVKPLFPSVKKQKLCAEVGDGFLPVVSRTPKLTSSSPLKTTAVTGSSASSPSSTKGGGATRDDLKTQVLHKRQRMASSGLDDEVECPITAELSVSHMHHRHLGHHLSKRQKSSSTH